MNIFVLDKDPIISAQLQCDKHIVKMPLETAQMLCSVWHRYGSADRVPYKEAHKNHPCTLWAGNDAHNYDWLWRHGMELCFEYTRRYNNIHKCQAVIMDLTIDNVGFAFEHMSRQGTPHPLCMPDVHKEEDNAVLSYRRYYANDKKDIAKWEKTRPMPDWYASGAYKIDVDFDIMGQEFANLGAYDG